MGKLTIPDLDEALQQSLRERAARHGRSAEEEAWLILRAALLGEGAPAADSLADAVRGLFAPLGGVALDLPAREAVRPPPELGR